MPEQITKYPDVTIQVLKGAGARCGEGAPQRILTACPPARFCSTPSGELCLYGLDEIPRMTQVKVEELRPIVCAADTTRTAAAVGPLEVATLIATFAVGVIAGLVSRRRRKT